jgi:hypothetical protein
MVVGAVNPLELFPDDKHVRFSKYTIIFHPRVGIFLGVFGLSRDRITLGKLSSLRKFISLNENWDLAVYLITIYVDSYFASSFGFPSNVAHSLRVRI